jgi:hypothetical protein
MHHRDGQACLFLARRALFKWTLLIGNSSEGEREAGFNFA